MLLLRCFESRGFQMHLHGGEIVASPAWAKAHQLSERLTGTPPPAGRMLENIVTAEARLTIPKGDPARTVAKHLAKACQRGTLSALVPKIAPVLALTGGGGRSARPLPWDSLWHLALGCAVLTCISMALMLWQRYATHQAHEAAAA